ncbi:MAG: SseB family protein [Firmicutes bacterium]|nr:SseB family protein [Bacillota bacterium]
MALFKKNKKNVAEEESVKKDDALRDDISKAYDDIMTNGLPNENEEKKESEKKPEPAGGVSFETEVFKSKIKQFREKKTQETLLDVIKMLPGREFLLPSVSNMKEPFEKADGKIKLKKGAAFNPALLTSKDNKVFLPIFTDEQSMKQKSPSGVILKFKFEQCVSIVYDEKNPVWAVVINPFTENMIIGDDLLKMVFKPKKKEN